MTKWVPWFFFVISSSTFCEPTAKDPIVLVHGMLGGKHLGVQDYWGSIPKALRDHGATVYVAEVDQAAPSSIRAKRLYRQLKHWGHEKYHLIGHSQGGIDARIILARHPAIVASVTTVSTPHWGSRVADKIYEEIKSNQLKQLLINLSGKFIGHAVGLLNGHWFHQHFSSAVKSLTTAEMARFNKKFPVGVGSTITDDGETEYQGVKLYSWGSEGNHHDGIDMLGWLLAHVGRATYNHEENDGLVGVESMRFGLWLGVVENANHAHVVGGTVAPVPEENMRVLQNIYLTHADRLYSVVKR